MDKNQFKAEVAKIKQLATKEERELAVDKIMEKIDDLHFNAEYPEKKEALNEFASILHEFKKFYEKGIDEFNKEFKKIGDEANELQSEYKDLEKKIRDLQSDLDRLKINKDYKQLQFRNLQGVAELFEAK